MADRREEIKTVLAVFEREALARSGRQDDERLASAVETIQRLTHPDFFTVSGVDLDVLAIAQFVDAMDEVISGPRFELIATAEEARVFRVVYELMLCVGMHLWPNIWPTMIAMAKGKSIHAIQ